MTRDPVIVYQGASVTDAAQRMPCRHVPQLPVTDADDRFATVVTELDLRSAVAESRKRARARART